MADTLNEAVTKAVETEAPVVEAPVVETPVVELTDIEKQQAFDLFKGLKDPTTQGDIIDFLAKKGGYTKAEAKAVVKEAIATVKEVTTKDILTEALGEEYSHLIDKLGPAFDKVIEKSTGKTQEQLKQIEQKNELKEIETETSQELTSLSKKYYTDGKLPSEVEVQMSKVMDNFIPTSNMSIAEYLETVYFASLGKLGKAIPTPSAAAAAVKNVVKSRIPSEIASNGRPAAQPVKNERLSLKDSVEKALQELNSKG